MLSVTAHQDLHIPKNSKPQASKQHVPDQVPVVFTRKYLFLLFGISIFAKCCYRLPFSTDMLRCNSHEGKCYRLLNQQIKDQTKQMKRIHKSKTKKTKRKRTPTHIYEQTPNHTRISIYPPTFTPYPRSQPPSIPSHPYTQLRVLCI